ncbi:MAG: ABC-F family ATP-binding cassette domain-containing protein, partial [Candidatus Rokuibacteriota bacterium]
LWLEQFLRDYAGSVIMTCHDKDVMNRVVKKIVEIDGGQVRTYSGDYDFYEAARAQEATRREAEYERQQAALAKEMRFVERFRAQAAKAAQVQSRIKLLEKVVPIEVPPERKRIHFKFPPCVKSGRTVLELKHARKAYGNLVVFDDASLHVERGDRIALVGPNGAGKSTLMRMLSGEEAPDRGTRTVGHQVVTEYFAQDEAARLDLAPTVYETLEAGSANDMVPAIRNILGGFLFTGDDVYKKVAVLSGGERTRLAVARMLLRPSNTLLLDEPTNHLDLDSKDVLLEALDDYGGTLIIVSHDRYFVEQLATKIIEVGHGQAIVYPGTYREFLWHKEHSGGSGIGDRGSGTAPQQAPGPRPQASGRPKPKAQSPKPELSRDARKREDAARRQKQRALESLQK